MSDLRSACIEAMASDLWTELPKYQLSWPECERSARVALDALLGVLEDHADEWAKTTWSEAGYSWAVSPSDAESLLAVLREDKTRTEGEQQ